MLSLPLIGIPLMYSDRLASTAKSVRALLAATQVVGAIFMGLFVAVYVAGITQLPKYVVYHSEPTVRLAMSIVGVGLVALLIVAFVVGLVKKKGLQASVS